MTQRVAPPNMATKITPSLPGSDLSGAAKSEEIDRLLNILESNIPEKNSDSSKQIATLSCLKSLIRSAENADALFCLRGVEILCQHSFNSSSIVQSREALKCLANVLLLESKTRQMFVELGYSSKASERLKSDDREDELLINRILFLLTYGTTLDFNKLFDQNDLIDSINSNIARHSDYHIDSLQTDPPTIAQTQALSETLKLLFNLTQFYPHHAKAFSKSVLYIFNILRHIQLPVPVFQPPVNHLINSLVNLDLESTSSENSTSISIFPNSNPNQNLDRLITILDISVRLYKDEELETHAAPLIIVLCKMYPAAPASVQKHMQESLLPSSEDRSQPLGQSDTLASWLLRLSTSPVAPSLRETISNLMFEVSDQDPTTFVRNVGYGFASGFLVTHNLPVPTGLKNDGKTPSSTQSEDPGAKLTLVDGLEINPVTGQRKDMEPVDPGPEMTDEEKEREAEKLFVLFERLKATGVINVVNPVEQAMREGRLEELEDEENQK